MTRARLPIRRGHEPVSFEHGGIAGIGRFPNGRLAGMFLNKRATGAEGAERWRLYSQELPEPRVEVSGLPDHWGRR
jgi:hypothetical protein